MKEPDTVLQEEWDIYIQASKEDLPEDFDLYRYWKGMRSHIPSLAEKAIINIWQKCTSVDTERSFSQYKHLLFQTGEKIWLYITHSDLNQNALIYSNPLFFSDQLELLTTEDKNNTVPSSLLLNKLNLNNTHNLQAYLPLTIDIEYIEKDIQKIVHTVINCNNHQA